MSAFAAATRLVPVPLRVSGIRSSISRKFDIRHGGAERCSQFYAKFSRVWIIAVARFLIVLGLVILSVGLLWPYLARFGLGRLPGDIVIQRDNVTVYVPFMTCLVLSVVFSLLLWVVNR